MTSMTITLDVMMAATLAILVIERAWVFIKSATTNGKNGKSNGTSPSIKYHCPDHDRFAENITELKTDVKWIRMAIAKMNPSIAQFLDPRD